MEQAEEEQPTAASTPPTRRRAWRWARTAAIGLLAAIVAIWLVLFVTKGRFLKGPFERIASSLVERPVQVRGDFQLYFAPFDIKLLAEGLTVANPEWTTRDHLFAARRIDTRIAPLPLILGRWRLRWLDLTDASLDLEWNDARTANSWTFGDGDGGEPLELPVIGHARLVSAALRYRDPSLDLLVDLDFSSISSREARIGEAVRFTGDGRIRSTPFTLRGALLSPNQTLARGRNRLELDAVAANNRIRMTGTLPSLAEIEGVPLQVAAQGHNVAELLDILGIVVPQTRDYRLTSTLLKQGTRYRFGDLKGRFGDSDIAGAFTVDNGGERVHVAADLTTRLLDIVDVAPFIGYNPDVVARSGVDAAARATGAGPARLLPDANLRAEGLRAFDAHVRYRVRQLRSDNVPITDASVTVALNDGLLTLSPFNFTMARGTVRSDVRLDWRRRPARVTYDFRLGATPMARLLAGWGVADAGTSGTISGRLQLEGDGDTLHASLATSRGRIAFVIPQGALTTRNVQLSELDLGTFAQKMFEQRLQDPVNVNCGLVAFTVRRGVAAADPILIDTRKNVITGRGGFSFVTERIDLALRADAKKFSLFSGQSPVGIGGTFSEPALAVVSPDLLARAGAGLGLAVLAAPPAALLAFVDVGDAQSAACGPVLAGATASEQRTRDGDRREDVGTGDEADLKDKPRKKFLGIF